MAQTRTQIGEVIASLNAGDEVRVTWLKSGNTSVETGKVWDPPTSAYWGLGPDLLNPADLELVGIRVTKRVAILAPEPPVGSVAVFGRNDGAVLNAYKRLKQGWYATGDTTALTWPVIVAFLGSPIQTFQPGKVPEKPTINSVVPGDGSFTVNATLGADNGSSIEDVQVRMVFAIPGDPYDDTGWLPTGQTTGTFTINTATNGTLYTVRIRTINGRGASAESNAKSVIAGTPSAPTITAITPGDASASVAFTAPSSANGGTISNYEYCVRDDTDEVDTWVPASPADITSPLPISGLGNGIEYSIKIRALNEFGAGLESNAVSVTPAA